jgi:xanthine dehydrogenase YagR molybdenum-binding subunit
MSVTTRAIGAALDRIDGPAKVAGRAPYAFEQPVENPAYLFPVQAAIASGRVTEIDAAAAAAEPGVLAVLTPGNAMRLRPEGDGELRNLLQSDRIDYRNQFVGGVVAETPEIARHAAGLVRLRYQQRPHDVELRFDRDGLYAPKVLNAGYPTDVAQGDVDAALASSATSIDATYTTPYQYHNPMEPHASVAVWTDELLTIWTGSQGVDRCRDLLSAVLGIDPDGIRIISPHVGGAFGSKVYAHADLVLAVMAARLVPGRPVKMALTRQQMFSQAGYRTPTIQRLRLGADAEGRLTAIEHLVVEQTSKLKEFAEQTTAPTMVVYGAPNKRISARLAAVDMPQPTIMRAPGEAPGMYALESAIDELAVACRIDPVELRVRNDIQTEPRRGLPFSSRNLVACLREGARRFGWEPRDPTPRARRDDGWLTGTGVASSTYPVYSGAGGRSEATVRLGPDGRATVLIAAADMGTGTWTALAQIAADALEVPVEQVDLRIGDTAYPMATAAGGSSGINSWGSAIVAAARQLRELLAIEHGGLVPPDGIELTASSPENPNADRYAMHAFGAHFVEVRVREDSGEIRVPRMLGIFAVGQMINAKTGRSQLIGGMTMGLSMALHEEGVLDPRFGQIANHDFAEYHIASNADVGVLEADWLDEEDPLVNPMGSKGIGELAIVGSAAAVANAVWHATGVRVRDLPITLDKLLAPPEG